MTKEEWKIIRQVVKDVELYARDAAKYLRGSPSKDQVRAALRRLDGARAALGLAESRLTEYTASSYTINVVGCIA